MSTFNFTEKDLLRAKKVFEKTGSATCVLAEWAHREKLYMEPAMLDTIVHIITVFMKFNWDVKATWNHFHARAKENGESLIPKTNQIGSLKYNGITE